MMKFSKKLLAIFLTVSILGSLLNVSAMKSKADTRYVSEIFVNEPWNYGLRGDPGLWNALSEEFDKERLLISASFNRDEFKSLLETKICALCKIDYKDYRDKTYVYVKSYDHGGMSGGTVSLTWWKSKGIPLLIERYEKIATCSFS